jgi:hypothetical protein
MNPVLRENLEVLFGERHVLTVYYYLLVVLAPVEFGAFYTQSLGEQMWRGPGNLFKVCTSAALVLIVYFALRVANQEYAPGRFKPLGHWLTDGSQVGVVARGRAAFLLVHVFCLLLLSAPLLIWAAAISRTPLLGLAAALALIPFYALCYGVWGLVTSVLWEGKEESETREFAVRCFIVLVVVAALAVYLPLNPIVYLFAMPGRQELAPVSIAGVSWSADSIHFAFHLALGGAGLAAHRWALKRALQRGHR